MLTVYTALCGETFVPRDYVIMLFHNFIHIHILSGYHIPGLIQTASQIYNAIALWGEGT